MRKVVTAVVWLAAIFASWGPLRAQETRWLDTDATVRRLVTCEPATTGLPGDDLAVVTFYTAGKARPNGEDIRVFAEAVPPQLVLRRVLMTGPGDQIRLAFATVKGVRRYHVYYGNPKAEAPAKELEIRRGLLYEVHTGEAAAAQKVEAVERAFQRGAPQGAAFVDTIFLAFNPFGENGAGVSRFTGYLNIDKPGEYRLATTSDDCSFVLVDDQPVVQWGGLHGAVANARFNAPVTLAAGLHKLTYWHAQAGKSAIAECAWLPPGETKYVVIPKTAFAPVVPAQPVEIQYKGQGLHPDFDVVRAGEGFLFDFYPVRIEFKNCSFPAGNPKIVCRWDFGDGQTSDRPNPSHVYLRHGTYQVRLALTWGPQTAEIVNRVVVERNWWRQALNEIEPLAGYASMVAAYDLKKLDTASLLRAAQLFERTDRAADRTKALELLVFEAADPTEAQMNDGATQLAQLYRAAGRYAEAVKAYARGEARTSAVATKASLALAATRVTLDDLNQPAEAEREFRRVLKDYAKAPPPVLRDAHIGIGDAICRRGDAAAALEAYREARRIPLGGLADANPMLRESSLARYVDEYTRRAEYESAENYLRTWYREFPAERITGQAPLLEARLRLAQHAFERVVRVAEQLVTVNRDSAFAPDVLYLAAEADVQLKRELEARKVLAQIVDDYPEAHCHQDAADLLAKLGGRPPEASTRK